MLHSRPNRKSWIARLVPVVVAVFAVPFATLFYIFEVVIVVSIQAFIFAALSAIYIGSAIEPEH